MSADTRWQPDQGRVEFVAIQRIQGRTIAKEGGETGQRLRYS